MKILSSTAVTKDDLTAMDEKQNEQIRQLKLGIAGSFVLNVCLSLALFFFR